jgi:transforming growth factor-beta-induced protein
MRRILPFVMIITLLLAAVPALAQQDEMGPGLLIEIVFTYAGDPDEPEFTTFQAAVQAADPVFRELMMNPAADLTVFAPTDAAFGDLLQDMNLTAEELLADADLLNQVLAYHVVPGRFTAESVIELQDALLGTFLPGTALKLLVDDGRVLVNESEVIMPNLHAENGVMHMIDAVLLPAAGDPLMDEEEVASQPGGSIAEIISASADVADPDFTILYAALQAADPVIRETLSGHGPFTLFAPTDAAFAGLLEEMDLTPEELLADEQLLTAVLLYHVVPGTFTSSDLFAIAAAEAMAIDADAGVMGMENVRFATLLPGTTLAINLDGDTVGVLYATVTRADHPAANGILHVIDSVLVPPLN